jgi:hypothetical protein
MKSLGMEPEPPPWDVCAYPWNYSTSVRDLLLVREYTNTDNSKRPLLDDDILISPQGLHKTEIESTDFIETSASVNNGKLVYSFSH